jgi:hypothetical protein
VFCQGAFAMERVIYFDFLASQELISILIINLDADIKLTATELLKPFINDDQKIESFIAQAKSFVKVVNERFKPKKSWVEMPVTALNEDNQTIKGSIDLLFRN